MAERDFERLDKPRYVWIETSDRCNLACTMCDRTAALAALKSEGGFISMELVEKILAWLEPEMTVNIGGFGEPFLHPEYVTILRRVKEIGCRTISYTNGLLIDDRTADALVACGMDDLSISIDGATEATYSAIRGADLNRLRERIKYLTTRRNKDRGEVKDRGETKDRGHNPPPAWDPTEVEEMDTAPLSKGQSAIVSPEAGPRNRPRITLQMVGMRDNIHEAAQLVRFAKETGADAVTIVNLACNIPETKPQSLFLHPELWKKHFAEAEREAASLGIPLALPRMDGARGHNPLPVRDNTKVEEMDTGSLHQGRSAIVSPEPTCHGFFRDMFIMWDGLVGPCGIERYVLGDVSVDSLDAVWHGEEYEHYRRRWEAEGPEAVCTNCIRLTNDKEAWINPPRPPEPVRLAYRRGTGTQWQTGRGEADAASSPQPPRRPTGESNCVPGT